MAQNFTQFYYKFKKKGLQAIESSYSSFPLEITSLLEKLSIKESSFELPLFSSYSSTQRTLNSLKFGYNKPDLLFQLDKEVLSLEKKVNSTFLMLNDQEIKGFLDDKLAYLLNSAKIFVNQEFTQKLTKMKQTKLSHSLVLERNPPSSSFPPLSSFPPSSSLFPSPSYIPPLPSSFPPPTLHPFPPPSSFHPRLSSSFHLNPSSSLSPPISSFPPPSSSLPPPSKPIGYHSDIINVVCFIPEFLCVASAGGDHIIKFWNLKVGEDERKKEQRISRNEGGKSEEGGWKEEGWRRVKGGKEEGWGRGGGGKEEGKVGTLLFELRGHYGDIWDLVYYDNEVIEGLPRILLFSAGSDKIIKLWDLTKKICLKNFIGHLGVIRSLALFLKKEGDINKETVGAWREWKGGLSWEEDGVGEAGEGEEEVLRGRRREEGRKRERKRTISSLVLYSGGSDSTIRSWDVMSGKFLGGFRANSNLVRCIILNPLRPHLLSGGGDPFLYVFELFPKMRNLEVVLAVEGEGEERGWNQESLEGIGEKGVGKRVGAEATAGRREGGSGGVEVWGGEGEERGRESKKRRAGQMWSLLGIGRMGYIVSSGSDRSLKVWSALNYRLIRRIETERCLNRVIFVGKGRVAASASDGAIELWSIEKGGGIEKREVIGEGVSRREEERRMEEVQRMVGGLAWGEKQGIVSGGWDGVVRLWNDLF